jgi:hypothetical protein
MFGVDARMAPNAGVSTDVLALSLMPETTQQLLTVKPLQGPGPLANLDRPLATAWHFDLQQLIEVAQPWIDYGLSQMDDGGEMEEWVEQLKTVLELVACFRGASGVSYLEGDVLVTHSQSRFADLEE